MPKYCGIASEVREITTQYCGIASELRELSDEYCGIASEVRQIYANFKETNMLSAYSNNSMENIKVTSISFTNRIK